MIYFLLVDRFANGDPTNDDQVNLADPQAFHGGDLAGVTQHLDWLSDIGVDTLWIGPIARMRTEPFYGHGAFHGYWTRDLGQLEPRFGTPADLAALTQGLEQRGIGLVLDVVYNHLAPEHPWVKERPDWFHRAGPIVNWHDAAEVVTHDVHGLPDLAQENREVRDWLRDTSLAWLAETGAAGFRLDAVRHLDPAFLASIGSELRAGAPPGFQLWGEVFDGSVRTVLDTKDAAGLDAVFDFPLHYAIRDVVCDRAAAAAIPAVIDRTAGTPPSAWITFLDNHDTSRITSACHGDHARVDLALELLFALRGRPMITWGTEHGLLGAGEPENRADMPWGKSEMMDRLALLRLRVGDRRASPALADGSQRTLALGSDWFAVERRSGSDVRWVIYNDGEGRELLGSWVDGHSVAVFNPAELGLKAPRVRAGRVRVKVAGAPKLAPGDSLRLVGSAEALGDWRPEAAAPVPGVVALPAGASQFKLVVVHADGSATWSPAANAWALGAPTSLTVSW